MANKDFGYVWEGEAQGVSSISGISFDGASSVNEVDAVAFGINADGSATAYTAVVSGGKLTYSSGAFACECPFSDCVSWKLFIWRRNEALSVSDISWAAGQTIPVSAIITELNLLRKRVEDMTTNVGRSVRVPEQGANAATIIPPLEARAGQVAGYDALGNPATGDSVPEVKTLYDARDEAVTAAAGAKASELEAGQYANEAAEHSSDASEALAGARQAATDSSTFASRSEASANTSRIEADRAEAAKADIVEFRDDCEERALAAADSATAAANSAGQAKTSQQLAASNANAAGQYASNASTSASSAASSANVAGTKASAASSSAKAAAQSETNAANSANAAASSATNAATSATNAKASETNAATSATNAGNSATAAAESAEQAAQSAEALANVYTKPQLDGVDTGAEVTLKMNEIIAQLKDWEEVTGETLPLEFWEALMAEFQRWQENPTETKTWRTTITDGVVSTTSPYYDTAPTKPVVDFSITVSLAQNINVRIFNKNTNVPIFLPSVTSGAGSLASCANNVAFIAPNMGSSDILYSQSNLSSKIYYPKLKNAMYLCSGARKFVGPAILPSANNMRYAFQSTAMTAETISQTLDSLPSHTSGTHVITFTGSPGASELTQDSPSVAAAVAKGWTVEL